MSLLANYELRASDTAVSSDSDLVAPAGSDSNEIFF